MGLYSKPLAYKACSITGPHQQYFGVNLPISKTIREKLDPKKTFQKPWGCSSEALPTSRIRCSKTIHGKPPTFPLRLVVVDLGALYGLGNLLGNEVQGIWRPGSRGEKNQRKPWFGWLKVGFVGWLVDFSWLVVWLVEEVGFVGWLVTVDLF